jgi:hypothetical protein
METIQLDFGSVLNMVMHDVAKSTGMTPVELTSLAIENFLIRQMETHPLLPAQFEVRPKGLMSVCRHYVDWRCDFDQIVASDEELTPSLDHLADEKAND